jgi:hypothetical protein
MCVGDMQILHNFIKKDWNICRFGALEPMPCGYQGIHCILTSLPMKMLALDTRCYDLTLFFM